MSSVRTATVTPVRRPQGHLRVPGDKSIAHRYALMAALSRGRSELRNYAPDADCQSTLTGLAALGVDVSAGGDTATVMGRRRRSFCSPAGPLDAGNSGSVRGHQTGARQALTVPGDFSSAAFWMVAAAAMPVSVVTLEDVGRNPTRTALISVLRKFGAHVDPRERADATGEPIGTIIVTGDRTGSIHIQPHEVPELIDELPAVAALAAHSGYVRVDAGSPLRIKGADAVSISSPSFFETLDRLAA
jgi:5-enolpyruvylshikimate-3-phosphate synthase